LPRLLQKNPEKMNILPTSETENETKNEKKIIKNENWEFCMRPIFQRGFLPPLPLTGIFIGINR
jgi:hypothetical protein